MSAERLRHLVSRITRAAHTVAEGRRMRPYGALGHHQLVGKLDCMTLIQLQSHTSDGECATSENIINSNRIGALHKVPDNRLYLLELCLKFITFLSESELSQGPNEQDILSCYGMLFPFQSRLDIVIDSYRL